MSTVFTIFTILLGLSRAVVARGCGAGSGAQPGANAPPAGRLSLFGLPCVCEKGWDDGGGTTKQAFGEVNVLFDLPFCRVMKIRSEEHKSTGTRTHLLLVTRLRSSPKKRQHQSEDACRIIVHHKNLAFTPPVSTCPETSSVATSPCRTEASPSCKSAFQNPADPRATSLATTSCTPPTRAAAVVVGRFATVVAD